MIDCNEHTTLDDFAQAILTVEGSPTGSNSPARTRQGSYFVHPPAFHNMSNSPLSEGFAENSTIANVIIAKNLDRAPKQIQVQALELMRTRRIYTRTSVQNTPKRFLFVALLAAGRGPRLTKHLNEHMFISHFHSAADSFSNLKEIFDEETFLSSATKKSPVSQSELVVSPRVSAAVRISCVLIRLIAKSWIRMLSIWLGWETSSPHVWISNSINKILFLSCGSTVVSLEEYLPLLQNTLTSLRGLPREPKAMNV